MRLQNHFHVSHSSLQIPPQSIHTIRKTILPIKRYEVQCYCFNTCAFCFVICQYLHSMILCLSWKVTIQLFTINGWHTLCPLSAGSVAHRLFPFPKCVVELYTLLEHSMHFLLLIYSECIVMWFRNINCCCKLGSELQNDWLYGLFPPLWPKKLPEVTMWKERWWFN